MVSQGSWGIILYWRVIELISSYSGWSSGPCGEEFDVGLTAVHYQRRGGQGAASLLQDEPQLTGSPEQQLGGGGRVERRGRAGGEEVGAGPRGVCAEHVQAQGAALCPLPSHHRDVKLSLMVVATQTAALAEQPAGELVAGEVAPRQEPHRVPQGVAGIPAWTEAAVGQDPEAQVAEVPLAQQRQAASVGRRAAADGQPFRLAVGNLAPYAGVETVQQPQQVPAGVLLAVAEQEIVGVRANKAPHLHPIVSHDDRFPQVASDAHSPRHVPHVCQGHRGVGVAGEWDVEGCPVECQHPCMGAGAVVGFPPHFRDMGDQDVAGVVQYRRGTAE
eukprot:gene1041-biopygen6208